MKKKINLLARKSNNNSIFQYVEKLKVGITVIGCLCFLVFLYFMYLVLQIHGQIADLSAKKKLYLSYLVEKKDTEANIRYFKSKESQLSNFMNDDARFLPYYSILRDALSTSTQSAVLDEIRINKLRETSFTVRFTSYEGVISFFKYVESDDFLSHFSQLTLSSFGLNKQTQLNSELNYELEFRGIFKKINE